MKISILISVLLASLLFGCQSVNKETVVAKQEVATTNLDLAATAQLVKDNKATVIDVRTDEEYAEGHIPNSVHIPLATVADSLEVFKKYKKIVVVCRSGGRAEKAKTILNENGFNNVYNGKGWAEFNELLSK